MYQGEKNVMITLTGRPVTDAHEYILQVVFPITVTAARNVSNQTFKTASAKKKKNYQLK